MKAIAHRFLLIALIIIAGTAVAMSSIDHAAASDRMSLTAEDSPVIDDVPHQDSPSDTGRDDDRVSVQVWTITAAVLAAAIGLLLFLLRAIMGWVKPPPAQEDHH